jgi:hypothetical protein
MKNQRIFPGIILIGFGAYLFLQQSGITIFQPLYSWPTLLIIIGIAFIGQGYLAEDHDAILPGVILAGFGLHYHLTGRLAFWPSNTLGMLVLMISIGFFLRFQKASTGLFQAFLFLVLALLLLFYEKIAGYLVLIILVGIYFLLKKKK